MDNLQVLEKLNILDKLDEKISSLQMNVESMKSDMQGMKDDMQGMKSEMTGMKTDLRALRYEMETGFKATEQRFDKVEDEIHIIRLDIENRIIPRIDALSETQDIQFGKSREVEEQLDLRLTRLEHRVDRLEVQVAG